MSHESEHRFPEGIRVDARFSHAAGAVEEPTPGAPYQVGFRRLPGARPVLSFVIVMSALLFFGGFCIWLMLPEHWPQATDEGFMHLASVVVTVSTGIIAGLLFLSVAALARATLLARNPVPVSAETGTRVAFLTTIVPAVEPIEAILDTLRAAVRIRHDGPFDVWLLDEGDDPEVKQWCQQLGVRHFSRRGVVKWNQPSGQFKERSKHGNYNSWLDEHGADYDFFLSVDPDHVPMPIFAERFLGYFRDPDVAFVVGPQVYGNVDPYIVRAAESQQFVFHSLVQRAGNRGRVPMLVGTNNAVRIAAVRAVGGIQDSVTEDLATSLRIHAGRNPDTGRRWTSVYTPDVIAVGEGPESFTDYFSQQARWSRGADRALLRQSWRLALRLGWRRSFHYALIIYYYPTVAITWVLGALNGLAYCAFGVSGLHATGGNWLMLYADAAAVQIGLYLYNRRHDVSPHETDGASGASGMLISAMSAPVHVVSLISETLGRRARFITTPKGTAGGHDSWWTFRLQFLWIAIFGIPVLLSFPLGNDLLSLRVWAMASLAVCVLPIAIWRVERRTQGRTALVERPSIEFEQVIQIETLSAEVPEPARRLAGEAA